MLPRLWEQFNPSFDQELYPKTCSLFSLFSGLKASSLCTHNSLDEHRQFIISWTSPPPLVAAHTCHERAEASALRPLQIKERENTLLQLPDPSPQITHALRTGIPIDQRSGHPQKPRNRRPSIPQSLHRHMAKYFPRTHHRPHPISAVSA